MKNIRRGKDNRYPVQIKLEELKEYVDFCVSQQKCDWNSLIAIQYKVNSVIDECKARGRY